MSGNVIFQEIYAVRL